MKYNTELLFPTPVKTQNGPAKRTYDVRITINKSGEKKQTIRFGLLNKAADEANKYKFCEVSDVEYLKSRIYFRFHNEQKNRNAHKLSTSKSKNGNVGKAYYFGITPTDRQEKQYRMNWVGKTYHVQYDEDNQMFYIENVKGD